MSSDTVAFFLSLAGLMLFAWLLALISVAVSTSDPEDAANAGDYTSNNLADETKNEGLVAIQYAIDAYRKNRHSEERQRGGRERITIAVLGLTAMFALLAAAAAIWSAWIFQGQLSSMEADQRPWISVDATPGDLIMFAPGANRPFPTLVFLPHFQLTNVGKSPAFNAQLNLLGYGLTEGHADPYAGQKSSCERVRKTPLDGPGRGHLLFPGQHFDEGLGPAGQYNVAFIGPTSRQYFTVERDGSVSISFYVIGCVDYIFGNPPEHHQTGFVDEVWNISKSDDGRQLVGRTFNSAKPISKDAIRIVPGPSSSLAD